jgi:hypothetical protein
LTPRNPHVEFADACVIFLGSALIVLSLITADHRLALSERNLNAGHLQLAGDKPPYR